MPRLIHLSDLHFGAHDPVLVTAVERRLDEEAPDLVVISGDFTQRARTEQFEEAAAFLGRVRAAGHEVLAVPGNHDVPLYNVLRRFLSPLKPATLATIHASSAATSNIKRSSTARVPLLASVRSISTGIVARTSGAS